MKGFNSLLQKLVRHQTAAFFVLTFITGIIVLSPYTDYHGPMASGDHGRDFYAFEQTMNGKVPYHDYWWVYGPLMPYYYAIFMKALGVTMASVLTGKILLILLAGLLFYVGLCAVIHPAFAYLASSWYLVFYEDFFFTHNHTGGILLIVGCACCLLHYLKNGNIRYLWWAAFFAATLSFVKVNFGFAALATLVLTTFIIDRAHQRKATGPKKLFYGLTLLGLPLLIVGVYGAIVRGLTIYEIRQCFPYIDADHVYNVSLGRALEIYAQATWSSAKSNWVNAAFGILLIGSTVRTFYLFAAKKIDVSKRTAIGLSLVILSLFYLANLHEFLKSGVLYRTVWSQPLSMMWSFVVIYTAVYTWPKRWRMGLWVCMLGLMSWGFYGKTVSIRATREVSHYLAHPRANIYLANSDRWINTVNETIRFMNQTLNEGELFFALPYDPLYYFLTETESPTRQLIFFDHIRIPPEQEEKIILELEQKHVRYILLSSRQNSSEPGLGILGQTYCPLIAQFINANFEQVAHFGDWENPSGWAWNHGTVIFKRR